MNKKATLLILIIALVLSFTSCGNMKEPVAEKNPIIQEIDSEPGEKTQLTHHEIKRYSNEFPGDKESATELLVSDELIQFFEEAYRLSVQFYGGFGDILGVDIIEYKPSNYKDAFGFAMFTIEEDGVTWTTDIIKEKCKPYYSELFTQIQLEKLEKLSNIKIVDGVLYVQEIGIPSDISMGRVTVTALYELSEDLRVLELHVESFNLETQTQADDDIVYFKLVKENDQWLFDDLVPFGLA